MLADIFTKPLGIVKHQDVVQVLGLVQEQGGVLMLCLVVLQSLCDLPNLILSICACIQSERRLRVQPFSVVFL